MKKLVLLRHGLSQWNNENRFTGWVDVPLSDVGMEEARNAGKLLKDTLLYRDLRGLVTQADSVLADLKKNPRKYINLSIF